MNTVIAMAAAAAAAMLAVFAGGFALYALIEPSLGAAASAAIVALAAALAIALYALFLTMRARRRERESAIARAAAARAAPLGLGDLAAERPLLAAGLTALSGLLAMRNPALANVLTQLIAGFTRR